jgi:hypothetical protein
MLPKCFHSFHNLDNSKLIRSIVEHYPKTSHEWMISQAKNNLKSMKYFEFCKILSHSLHFQIEVEEFQNYVDQGIFQSLLGLFKLNALELNILVLEIASNVSNLLKEMGMIDVLNLIFCEFMKIVRNSNSNATYSVINSFLLTLKRTSQGVPLNLEEINFTEWFEFILSNQNNSFLNYASRLLQFQRNVDQKLIDQVISKSFVILNSGTDSDSFSHFEEIMMFMKYEFRPWLTEMFKAIVKKLGKINKNSISKNDVKLFSLLRILIGFFKEECEIYISRYRIIDLLILFLKISIPVIIIFIQFSRRKNIK